jgi:hemolysin III
VGVRASAARDAAAVRAGAARAARGERASAAREAASDAIAAVKPKLRGVSHEWAFFVSLFLGAGLILAADSAKATLAVAIYAVSLSALLGTSALSHRVNWQRPSVRLWMRRLDHSMIFVLIAGTYTPFSVLLLPPDRATLILAIAWGGALAGVGIKLAWPHAPRWYSAPLYVALGWVAVFILSDLLHAGGVALLVLLLVGGVVYTLGAVFYALRRPTGWPRYFGHHEFFHACTLVAALAHHVAIYLALYA